MREILFRAKRIPDGKWVEGFYTQELLLCNTGADTKHKIITGYLLRDRFDVDPETVCQYTGLKDKDGKRIFEGDIILNDYGSHKVYGIVRFGEHGDQKFEEQGFYVEWQNDGANKWNQWWRHDLGFWVKETVLAGNIFDNKELLDD